MAVYLAFDLLQRSTAWVWGKWWGAPKSPELVMLERQARVLAMQQQQITALTRLVRQGANLAKSELLDSDQVRLDQSCVILPPLGVDLDKSTLATESNSANGKTSRAPPALTWTRSPPPVGHDPPGTPRRVAVPVRGHPTETRLPGHPLNQATAGRVDGLRLARCRGWGPYRPQISWHTDTHTFAARPDTPRRFPGTGVLQPSVLGWTGRKRFVQGSTPLPGDSGAGDEVTW